MAGRSTVMGFTEAELGFVLAALFIAVAGSTVARAEAEREAQPAPVDTTELAGQVTALNSRVQQLEEENTELRALTSQLTPPCDERGETRESVARVTVRTATTYMLNNVEMPIDSVFGRLKFWIDKSQAKRCRFYIDVLPSRELRANDYVRATNRLARRFYLRRAEAEVRRGS